VEVHLIDGTYELFRHFYAVPPVRTAAGDEVGATRGVLGSLLGMLEGGATHLGVATDHVIESFRNDLWPGYKTGDGIDPPLLEQFPLLEDALRAMGVTVWAMVEHEADDALATAARIGAADDRVERVFICTPDKDLAQSVVGTRVVQLDRMRRELRDADGVRARFGVPPEAIPDYLALVGDAADGYPGIPRWGAKSTAAVLARYGSVDAIPAKAADWDVAVRGAAALASMLDEQRDLALLFRDLARLRTDSPVEGPVDRWRWTGPTDAFEAICRQLEDEILPARAASAARGR